MFKKSYEIVKETNNNNNTRCGRIQGLNSQQNRKCLFYWWIIVGDFNILTSESKVRIEWTLGNIRALDKFVRNSQFHGMIQYFCEFPNLFPYGQLFLLTTGCFLNFACESASIQVFGFFVIFC